MAVNTEIYDGIALISVDGDLADEQATRLRKAVADTIESRHLAEFVIDLSACVGVDSEGLESLLFAKSRCDALYGRLRLALSDPNVLAILDITRLRPRFDCSDTPEAAMKSLRS